MSRIIRWFMLVSAVVVMGSVLAGQAAATESSPLSASAPIASPTVHPPQGVVPQQAEGFRVYLPLVLASGGGGVQPTQTARPTTTTAATATAPAPTATTPAATATTPAPTATAPAPTATTPAATAPAPTATATTVPTTATGDPLPADLAGTWFEGNLFLQDLYDPSSGHWASPSGLGQMYRFGADGTYTYMGFLHIQNGGCVTDVSVYKQGSVRLAPTVLTLHPSIAKTRTVTHCGSNDESITEGPFDPYQIGWQVKYDDGGRLKLYIPDGDKFIEYYKEGMAPALVGGWSLNGVASANFYDPATGQWTTPANDGAWFRFAPDGTYQFGEYGHGQDQQGCAVTYWVYQAGSVKVTGGQLRYQATSGRGRMENGCTPGEVRDEPYVDPKLYEFSWDIRDRATAPKLAISPLGQFRYIIFNREQ